MFQTATEKSNITYMEGRQLQHHWNVNRSEDKFHHDCSSEEKTLFQYISHHSGELDRSLVQNQLGRQQYLYCIKKYMYNHNISSYAVPEVCILTLQHILSVRFFFTLTYSLRAAGGNLS